MEGSNAHIATDSNGGFSNQPDIQDCFYRTNDPSLESVIGLEDTAFEICRGGGIWYILSIEGRYYGCPGSAKTKLQDMVALSSRVKDLKYKTLIRHQFNRKDGLSN